MPCPQAKFACPVAMYVKLVAEDRHDDDANFWQDALRGQIFMGDENFAARMQALAEPERSTQREVPRAQRLAPTRASPKKAKLHTWKHCLTACAGDRDAAVLHGYREQGWTMTALAQATALSVSRVSRVIAAMEARDLKGID